MPTNLCRATLLRQYVIRLLISNCGLASFHNVLFFSNIDFVSDKKERRSVRNVFKNNFFRSMKSKKINSVSQSSVSCDQTGAYNPYMLQLGD